MSIHHPIHANVPVIGLVAKSGTGKTTLLTRVIPLLRDQGLRVAVIKHTHHDVDIDQPGKDSYELRRAGAAQMLLAAPKRMALVIEHDVPHEPELQDCLDRLDQSALDLILVEGFKYAPYPKIQLQRSASWQATLPIEDDHVIAVATDISSPAQCRLPILDIDNPQQVCDFIIQTMKDLSGHE